jgi:hypothetical protein
MIWSSWRRELVCEIQCFAVPAHCTGWRAVRALAAIYQDAMLAPSAA